jgi:hypothetical protein
MQAQNEFLWRDRLGRLVRTDHLRFAWRQRVTGFEVGAAPWFGCDETIAWWEARLAAAKSYLEYGSGGSTVLAARLGVRFVTVDSDRYFLRAVKRRIVADGAYDAARQTYVYADIGLTGAYGHPTRWPPHRGRRLARFARYSDVPAAAFSQGAPDLVLVDGRFRVACALKALRALAERDGWTIVVDDFENRPFYAPIAEFARLERHIGRMAAFAGARAFDPAALDRVIAAHESDPR